MNRGLWNPLPKRNLDFDHLHINQHEHVAVVTINRPEAYNTLTLAVLGELTDVFLQFKQQSEIRVVILHGNGGEAFAAGADLNEVAALDGLAAVEFARRGQRLFNLIESGPQVVIAAIDGYCMGGGLDLALACHLRYASERSVFAHPGARLGLITGFGGTVRLPRLIGRARAVEVFLTGKKVSAGDAYRLGLVDKVIGAGSVLGSAIETAIKLKGRTLNELQAATSEIGCGLTRKMDHPTKAILLRANIVERARTHQALEPSKTDLIS